jgi:hypothetical protein
VGLLFSTQYIYKTVVSVFSVILCDVIFRNMTSKAIFDAIRMVIKIIHYQNKCLNSDILLHLLKKHCSTVLDAIETSTTTTIIQRACNYKLYECIKLINTPNKYGIFVQSYRPANKVVYGYYFTFSPVCIPPTTKGCWYHSLYHNINNFQFQPTKVHTKYSYIKIFPE